MLDVLKNEYVEGSSDTIVEEFTKDDYQEFQKRLVEYPIHLWGMYHRGGCLHF